ncbi:ArsR/SmtB family transcription factor [Paenibacillus sp. GCM10023252]|uniref:ArsR/SmtB family transcription factor n=1 Tax=Paenibacillus sp. GCM10023252 TaxID=3252649 RepID=UPI00360B54B2
MNTTTLSALAEPNRLLIVELLREGPLTVGEIADRLHMRQPQASKHLKVLNEAEIVEVRPDANRRYYRLRSEPLQEMDSWLGTFRQMWEDRLDRLDDYLRQLQQAGKDEQS